MRPSGSSEAARRVGFCLLWNEFWAGILLPESLEDLMRSVTMTTRGRIDTIHVDGPVLGNLLDLMAPRRGCVRSCTGKESSWLT